LFVAGIDWETAKIDVRGSFSFAAARTTEIMTAIRKTPGVNGCILLSTCNRTELYVSAADSAVTPPPVNLLFNAVSLNASTKANYFAPYFRDLTGDEAVNHIFELACGLKSQILGDEQILTQLKQAAVVAREGKTSDGILQTLFRLAVTAGKESRTQTRITGTPPSVALTAVTLANERLGGLKSKRAVIIGNGELGKLCAAYLLRLGCRVGVTLRSFRHGASTAPEGCVSVPFDDRLTAISGCDLLISATASPHLTLSSAQLNSLPLKPKLIIDLAVPNDIDPLIRADSNVQFINMDDLDSGGDARAAHISVALNQINAVISKRKNEFYKWLNYRDRLAAEKVCAELE
jgi:glutamyl-tRNA reductase